MIKVKSSYTKKKAVLKIIKTGYILILNVYLKNICFNLRTVELKLNELN